MFHIVKGIALSCLCSAFVFGKTSVKDMTLEEKAGQILMVHFHGEVANDDAKTLVHDVHAGAVIYYNWANGLTSPTQVQTLSLGLEQLAQKTRLSIPLIIAADQEGGVVARLTQGFTVFPGNKALGMTGDPHLAESCAYAIGQELRAVGVNMNLAPVLDININPKNPVIGVRSFGDTPEAVIAFGRKALQGYHRAQIIDCEKHYPGHGDVSVDSHEDLPIVNKTKEELEKVELLPFAKLASQADAVMTAHILVPALDPDHCATLSAKILGHLRDQIGFQGVIMTDSLVMEGVLKKCGGSIDEAVIQAFNAGCDMLCLGGKQLTGGNANLELTVADVQRIHGKIVEAVKSGRISEEKLNQSVERVLKMKERYALSELKSSDLQKTVHTANHQALAQKVADLALKTIKNDSSSLALAQKKIVVIAPQVLQGSIGQTSLLQIGKETDFLFFNGLSPQGQDVDMAKEKAKTADVFIICSYNAWKNPGQITLVQALISTGKPIILLAMRDPLDATLFPQASAIFTTFSPTAPAIQAVCDRLRESLQ